MFIPQSTVALLLCLAIACTQCFPISKTADVKSKQRQQEANSTSCGLFDWFGHEKPTSLRNAMQMIEDDIIVHEKGSNQSGKQDKARSEQSAFWPNGVVVYEYHESVKPSLKTVIENAMTEWTQSTCITFRPRETDDKYFVLFRSDSEYCRSSIGRVVGEPGQGQDLELGPGCEQLNTAMHELGHALGFYHEHSRSDRDKHIEILWSNVIHRHEGNFGIRNDSNRGVPYDLTSVMHYTHWLASKKPYEKHTMVAKNPAHQRFLKETHPLSFRDIKLANIVYQCSVNCTGSCKNDGYMRPTGTGGQGTHSCTCECPPNFAGPQCEKQVRADYYEDLPCGGIVTEPGRIETPDFPKRKKKSRSCVWDVRAPQGKKISIEINGFEFAPRSAFGQGYICSNESVEFRLNNENIYDGQFYCGNDLLPGQVLETDGPKAVIIILADKNTISMGMSATVNFLGDDEQVGRVQQQTSLTRNFHKPATENSID